AGPPVQRRWGAGRPDVERPGGQVDAQVHGRGEAVLPGVVEQVGVGRGQELARLERRDQAAHRAGEQEGAGAGTIALAGDVDHGDVESSGRDVPDDEEVTGEPGAPGRT